jgi:hypothetical protein
MTGKTVTVAGIKMALPAFLTALTGVVVGFLLAYKGHLQLGTYIMVTLLLQSYTVNCQIAGKCNILAWIMMATALLSTLTFFQVIRKGGVKLF